MSRVLPLLTAVLAIILPSALALSYLGMVDARAVSDDHWPTILLLSVVIAVFLVGLTVCFERKAKQHTTEPKARPTGAFNAGKTPSSGPKASDNCVAWPEGDMLEVADLWQRLRRSPDASVKPHALKLEDLCLPIFPADPDPPKRDSSAVTSSDLLHMIWDSYSSLGDPPDRTAADALIGLFSTSDVFSQFPDFDLAYVAYSGALAGVSRFEDAEAVLDEAFAKCQVRSTLCLAMAEVKWVQVDPVALGWFMQACLLGYESWKPYLVLANAARSVGLEDLAARLFNAVDVLDSSMRRFRPGSAWWHRNQKIAGKEITGVDTALRSFERLATFFLPPVTFFPSEGHEGRADWVIITSNFSDSRNRVVSRRVVSGQGA